MLTDLDREGACVYFTYNICGFMNHPARFEYTK